MTVAPTAPGPPGAPPPAAADPYLVYLASLSAAGATTMRGCLDRLARLLTGEEAATGAGLPWASLRYAHTAALRAALVDAGLAPATVNKHLVGLRRVLREAWRLGQMSADDYAHASAVRDVPGSRPRPGRALADRELAALLGACAGDPRPAGVRDAALLALLYSSGLRRAELVRLDLADWAGRDRAVTVRAGKGDRHRVVYATEDAAALLDRWLALRSRSPGPLFTPIDKASRIVVRRLSGQTVAAVLAARSGQAGIARATPHDLRRTFISALLDAGADVITVQALAGHASPTTTAGYDRRPERARRAAVDLLPPLHT
ncbi:MAG TPA: tyrosine-type recombinase/integrase, partial [Frankiaceae bacterium]|nr:tyrosine-type recombinase/integrase [Frankiaceae bacterium]